MKKRNLWIALILCLALLLLPGLANRAEAKVVDSGTCGTNLTWTLDDAGTLTISGTGEMEDSWDVSDAPWYSLTVKKVIIKNGVTSIGKSAFAGCHSLTSVTIPSSVTSIWSGTGAAFSWCHNLTAINVASGNQNYKSIGGVLFNSKGTVLIQYPGGKTGAYTIPSGVTSIGDGAFDGCYSLTSVTIPASVTRIEGGGVGYFCNSLTAINVASGNQNYKSIGGVLFNAEGTYLIQYPAGKAGAYTIPSGVTRIGSAFFGCPNLTSVTIPAGVTHIDNDAFADCCSLKSVTIPSSVTYIGDAFWSCPNLTDVYYGGTSADWWAIETYKGVDVLYGVTIHYNYTAPAITTQPKSVTAADGKQTTFRVAATGSSLNYRWQYSKDNGSTWANSSATGYNTATLSVKADTARNGYRYRCIVKNAAGSVTSSSAKLTVVTAPKITTQPSSVSAAAGKTVKFTVAATGGGLTYQWQFSKDNGSTWSNSTMTGCKTATLSVEASSVRNGYRYRCVVKNAAGSVTSNSAKLTVSGVKPAIRVQPKSITSVAGKTVKFSVTAAGTGLSYRWQYSKDNGSTWANSSAAGYNTATLSVEVTSVRNGYLYRCVVKNSAGSVTSSSAKLTVITAPKITTQPSSITAAAGKAVKFTVKATGGGLSYQWQYSKDNGTTWLNSTMAGAKTATLSVEANAARNGYRYRCVVKNAAGNVTSSGAKLTVE